MNYIKSIITLSAIALTLSVSAQSNTQSVDETTIKKYQIERNGADSFYTLRIESMRNEVVSLEKSERYELNQDRVNNIDKVTKRISIDADNDGQYDRMITMSYKSEADESFSIVPSNEGFLITVIGEEIEYNLLKKDYEIEKKYVDLFDIMLSEAK
ncbi:hypothetical protein [Gilvibacter sp.]|uniref:hypothetical protein n=1 Tax=Gilvibacter sp. TaxID=2729997 RepID=UPI0025C1C471|nr:hypothetical protein [Gilvibacter sp.]NQX77950.1 hypothetical protein [Gilvibacter sp.]